jgi:SAM-dependent methyltransferase
VFTDIVDLRSFYLSPLGQVTRRLLRQRLLQVWPDLRGQNLLALGYATPILRPYLEQKIDVMAFMPAAQGVTFWPKEGPNRTAMVDPFNLPIPDNSLDRVLLMHVLEGSEDSTGLLREVWRVLKSGGRMLAVVPNRRGIWAMRDLTPFGHGQPFSPSQFKNMLRENNFMPERVSRALYLPPWQSVVAQRLGDFAEHWGERLVPTIGGVLFAEASKQLYAPVRPAMAPARKILTLPVGLMPSPDRPASRNSGE